MAVDPEALAQLARLLGDERLRGASVGSVRAAVDAGFEALVTGILEEAAASDDAIDRESAVDFVAERLRFFGILISDDQRSRLMRALRERIEAW